MDKHMQSSQKQSKGGKESSKNNNAFAKLVSLPPGASKDVLISTIDNAVVAVLSDLTNHEKGELPAELLMKVQTSLMFLEQCLSFKDEEFTSFAKKRANELQKGLSETISRLEAQRRAKKHPMKPDTLPPEPKSEAKANPEPAPSPPQEESAPGGYLYAREEKILLEIAYDQFCKRLAFLRGDTIKVENLKQVHVSGVKDDGVAPFFIMSPQFPEIMRAPYKDLFLEKRDLLARRIYVHAGKEMSDEEVKTLFQETYMRDATSILALGFDNWAGDMSKAGIAGLPQEQITVGPKQGKQEDEGIGSSLKKVFSFGKKEAKPKAKKAPVKEPDCNAVRIHKEWEKLETQNVISLSQHFSYSILSYILNMSTKQFETEFECIRQIVDQQEEPDVGPVVSNLSRLYKFYDNIFFDLVILVLFQRKNKFDINMLQAACMSQNFVVDRLPLTMDELRRRPMEHAKHILRVLKASAGKEEIKNAVTEYMYVHETIHASKVGKRIQASENTLKRQGEKLDERGQKVIKGIEDILLEVRLLKSRQEEEGVYLGEEIQETIEIGIQQAVAHL